MSVHRTAATRRARLREILRIKTQADAATTQCELLQQLQQQFGLSLSLRTLKRDLRVLRGSVPKGPHMKRSGGVNRTETGSNMNMTKKMKQIEERLDAIEQGQLRIVEFLSRNLPKLYESDQKLMDLLTQTEYGRLADRKELLADREKLEQMNRKFTAAVRAAHHADHTHH